MLSIPRLTLTRFRLQLLVTLWISLLCNLTILRAFWKSAPTTGFIAHSGFVLAGVLFVLFVTLTLVLLFCLPWRGRSVRIALIILLVVASALSYFSMTVGMHFDRTMLQNLMQTDAAESADLVTGRLLAWVGFAGLLPSVVVWRTQIAERTTSTIRRAGRAGLSLLALAVVSATLVLLQYARFASAVRNHEISFHTVAPTNMVAAAISLARANQLARVERAPLGLDAAQKYTLKKPRLVVFLLGETTRAQNFGLNGYERDTTPKVRAFNPLYFANTISCGTSTAESLPCMFSGLTRSGYSAAAARSSETLIDVARHAGVRVLWRDNDGGCKGVCLSADEIDDLNGATSAQWCPEVGNCFDEILLEGLKEKITATKGDLLVVLHLKGSHGPAYYKRYPKAFERFTPACNSNDLDSCTPEQLRNAYDNTIVYGDHMIASTIELLQAVSGQFATSLLYVSDHGESLGENGMYLHGLPYAMAPETQTRVPMLAWLSPEFVRMESWNVGCLQTTTNTQRSHDNVFHTVLGLLEVDTKVYDRALDIFAPCDDHPAASEKR